MNCIWNNNIKAFKNRFPGLSQLYSDYLPTPPTPQTCPFWTITPSKTGTPTACENTVHLHSSYNPEREAASAVSQPAVAEKTATVFYGFGLGYHVIEWAKKYQNENKKLIVIEPDPERFFAALSLTDWTEVFKIEQLVLAIGCPAESVLPLIENQEQISIGAQGVSDAYFFNLPAFTAHSQNYFDTVKTIIDRNISKNSINTATYEKFAKRWITNTLKNLKNITEASTIQDYKDCCKNKDIPFLLVAAGPSLQNILPHIKELQKHCIIICVETALRALLQSNVQPDFIILTDPQYWAYRHISGLSSPESVLITDLTVYPDIYNFNCHKKTLCSSMFPLSRYFESKLLDFGDLGAGGSVASSAWNFAWWCGAKTIYTAGLDLGFSSKQTHIRGSSAEQTIHTKAHRLTTAQKFTVSSMYSANPQYAENYLGKQILTDSRMKMFAWWFESRLAACPEVKTFTLNPEGMKIPGITWQENTLEHLLASPEADRTDFKKLSTSKPLCTSNEYPSLTSAFHTDLTTLTALVNQAVEQQIIDSTASTKVLTIEKQITASPLYELLRIATPDTNKKIEIYQSWQKTLKLVNIKTQE